MRYYFLLTAMWKLNWWKKSILIKGEVTDMWENFCEGT
jgi:hypothetical protein